MPSLHDTDRAAFAQLTTQIGLLEAQLHDLYLARAQVQARLDAIVYPVLSLPLELLNEVFMRYLPPYPVCAPLRGDLSPLKLAQVCRLWRDAAVRNPLLWRGICIPLDRSDGGRKESPADSEAGYDSEDEREEADSAEADAQRQLDLGRIFLERSQSVPLSVVIAGDTSSSQMGSARCEAIAAILEDATRVRLEHLRVHVPPTLTEGFASSFPERHFPVLKELQLISQDSDAELTLGPIRAPNLTALRVRISNDNYYTQIFDPSIWRNLTVLMIQDILPDSTPAILLETPNLQHCWLTFWSSSSDVNFPDRLELAQLETFIFDAGQCRNLNEIFAALSLPRLRRLALKETFLEEYARSQLVRSDADVDRDAEQTKPVDALVRLVRRFGAGVALNRLCIIRPDLATREDEYRAAFPEVEEVEFYRGPERDWVPNPEHWVFDWV